MATKVNCETIAFNPDLEVGDGDILPILLVELVELEVEWVWEPASNYFYDSTPDDYVKVVETVKVLYAMDSEDNDVPESYYDEIYRWFDRDKQSVVEYLD